MKPGDQSLRALERAALSGAGPEFAAWLQASERLGDSLVRPLAGEARVLLRLRDAEGEWLHPWPKRTRDLPNEGRWWAPSIGAGPQVPGGRDFGDPSLYYLTPTTDAGRAWWTESRARPFATLGELAEFLASVELLELRLRPRSTYEVTLKGAAGELLWTRTLEAVSARDAREQGARLEWPRPAPEQITLRRPQTP